jgi:uncharacterized membrane protein YdjX (TVP38/TMEM64 family)
VRIWRVLLGLLVTAVAVAALLLPVGDSLLGAFLWMQAHPGASWLLFVLIYIVGTVCFVPAAPMTLAGGALFGVLFGTLLVSVGATIGATLAFLIGRTIARDWIMRRIGAWPRFRAIDRAVGARGFAVVLLARLTPALPFFLLNYAFGVTSVRLRDYLFGSWLGMIPLVAAYAYAGSLAVDLAGALSGGLRLGAASWALLGLGFAVTLALLFVLTRIARRQFALAIGEDLPENP